MARATGPLFSIEAAGTLGKTVVYQTQNGQAVVKMWAKPKNPKTASQKTTRALAKYLTAQWQHLTPEEQSSWLNYPSQKNAAAYHHYLGENMRRQVAGLGMSTAYPATPAYGDGFQMDFSGIFSDGSGYCKMTNDAVELITGWTVQLQKWIWVEGTQTTLIDTLWVRWWEQDADGKVILSLPPYDDSSTSWDVMQISLANGFRPSML